VGAFLRLQPTAKPERNADTVVRPLTDRLRALNNLRVIEAHLLSTDDVMKQLERWGVTRMPSSMRLLWHVAVDATATALRDLAALVRDAPRLTRV
jgi:hypothetical protein